MKHEPTMRQVSGNDDEVRFEAAFPAASPAQLFAYFTQPGRLIQWWPQTAEIEPRVGGRYRLAWPAMEWVLSGEFTDFAPARRLAFTWQWAHQPELPVRHVTLKFVPAGAGTRLDLTHGVYGVSEVEAADRQSHIDGWMHFLPRLQQVTDSTNRE